MRDLATYTDHSTVDNTATDLINAVVTEDFGATIDHKFYYSVNAINTYRAVGFFFDVSNLKAFYWQKLCFM